MKARRRRLISSLQWRSSRTSRSGRARVTCSRSRATASKSWTASAVGGAGGASEISGRSRDSSAAPHGPERSEDLLVVDQTASAKRVDPWREGQHLLALVTVAHEDAPAPATHLHAKLCGEAALADTGLADHCDEAGLTRPGGLERSSEPFELEPAADQGRLRRRRPGRRQRVVWSGFPRAAVRSVRQLAEAPAAAGESPDRAPWSPRPARRAARASALTQSWYWRSAAPRSPSSSVQAHQRPVHVLLHWIQRSRAAAPSAPPIRGPLRRAAEPGAARGLRAPARGAACARRPAIPRRRAPAARAPRADSPDRARQPVSRAARSAAAAHCSNSSTSVPTSSGSSATFSPSSLEWARVAEDPPQHEQRLAQARPGRPLAHLSPQQRGELVTQVGLAGGASPGRREAPAPSSWTGRPPGHRAGPGSRRGGSGSAVPCHRFRPSTSRFDRIAAAGREAIRQAPAMSCRGRQRGASAPTGAA